MQTKTWATWSVALLAVLATACSKQAPPASPAQTTAPTAAASSANAAADSQGQEDPSTKVLRDALAISRDLTLVPEVVGKFAGYDSIDAIAKRTNAQSNFQWADFASMVSGSMRGPFAYRSALGDFVALRGTTPDNRQIGLVVNLANQQVSLYPVGLDEISPAGDGLANALAVVLEVEEKVRQRMPGAVPESVRTQTIANLERAAGGQPRASVQAPTPAAAASGPFAELVPTQKEAITREAAERDARALGPNRTVAMEKRVVQALHEVFEDAKRSGLKLADPMPFINATNVGRRQTGVWQVTVEPYGSDPRFVVTRTLTTPSGMFALEGVGALSTIAFVRDPDFESTGKFSEDCMYEVFLRNRSAKFACMPFLEGKLDKQLVAALRDMVIAEVKEAAGKPGH